MSKSIILLSGGLDSLVALGTSINELNIERALTFDYGQKAAKTEIEASKKISEYYNLIHDAIKLDWLKEITKTALVSGDIPTENLETKNSAEQVWVPNRNGLFLNIAACYADSFGYDYIVFGANKDEGENFPDNTEIFRERISKTFEYSTLKRTRVVAPLINYTKNDIVRIALAEQIPLELVRSCYSSNDKHCGICESCRRLRDALKANGAQRYINILFEEQ